MTVRVVNNEEDGLSAEIWAVKGGSEDKSTEIVFSNSYKKPVTPEPKPTAAPAAQAKAENVDTGDDQAALPWVTALLVSALGTVLAVKLKPRHNR